MKITNRMNLPEALVKACSPEKHNAKNCVSATTLLQGVRQIILTERNWEELEDDVSNRIWALFGTAVHKLLETQEQETFTEERFFAKIGSWTVTGQVDCYDMKNGIINDYKTATVWKVINSDFSDWYKQGMIYAWLMKQSGFEVNQCRFISVLKDHSKMKAKTESNYPKSPVYVYNFPVTKKGLEEIEQFIKNKVALLERYVECEEKLLPVCSEEERWAVPDTFAVKKQGRKTALRVLPSREEAENWLSSQKESELLYIEERKGESKKCSEYCACCYFCSFYQALNKNANFT